MGASPGVRGVSSCPAWNREKKSMPAWHDKNFVYTLTKFAWETLSLGSPQFENSSFVSFPTHCDYKAIHSSVLVKTQVHKCQGENDHGPPSTTR